MIYNFTNDTYRGIAVWPYSTVPDTSNTTFDHNLIYSPYFSQPINVIGIYYSISNAPLTGTGNVQQEPIFKDSANKDFTLLPNSQGYKAASDGYDMGADTLLPPTPTPDDGGGSTPPPSSSSGGDSSASGGSGCGFVRDDSNRESKSQSGRATDIGLMIMLLLLLILIKQRKNHKYFVNLFNNTK